jgi:low affinity Fe/Cu permease
MNIDERFTDFTDVITESMGSWRVSLGFFVAIAGWGCAGPAMHFSDSWQLWVNTPTTIFELFLCLWQLAATNRIEKHIIHLLEHIEELVEKRTPEDIHTSGG